MRRLALLLLAVSCGGRATELATAGGAPSAAASGTAGASSGTAGMPSGGVLTLAGAGNEPHTPPPTCAAPVPACDIAGHSYVSIQDGPSGVQLSVPIDIACAACRIPCEDCSAACEVYGVGIASCGSITLQVAVCAGEDQAPRA